MDSLADGYWKRQIVLVKKKLPKMRSWICTGPKLITEIKGHLDDTWFCDSIFFWVCITGIFLEKANLNNAMDIKQCARDSTSIIFQFGSKICIVSVVVFYKFQRDSISIWTGFSIEANQKKIFLNSNKSNLTLQVRNF